MKSTIPAFFHSYYDQLPKGPAMVLQNGPDDEGASTVNSGRKKRTSTPKGRAKNKPQKIPETATEGEEKEKCEERCSSES